MTKVPAVVEGLMDFHFYDFTFQREVPVEGITNSAGTQWTRKSDRANDDNPSPKKPRCGDGGARQDNLSGKSDAGAGPSDYHQGRQHKSQAANGEPKLMRNQESDLLRKGIEMKGKSQQTLSRFINKTIWVTLGKMPTHLKKIFPKKKTTSNLLIQTKENHKM